MSKEYDPREIEKKWQKIWTEHKLYEAEDFSSKPKYYALIEFPYPSGDGLHVGHPRPYIGLDIIARKRRMEGFNVLFPIGWDAFGLPTENYAIKTHKDPRVVTKENTDIFRRQIQSLGVSFDWSREINTTDPKYYKWTQWIFLKFLEKGLAYKTRIAINWCPKDKIGLANEEVVDGRCERCGSPVEKKEKEQWMLAITKYADRLYDDLDTVDYPEKVKVQQKNWIGRSQGVEIDFKVKDSKEKIKVFTTRPDTIFGTTYLVLAPEHPFVADNLQLTSKFRSRQATNKKEIVRYIEQTKTKTDIERNAEGREKSGVELKGLKAINPAKKEEIPIWVADYALPHYGTGAIMAVPAHDERDFEFAHKFKLPIKHVLMPSIIDNTNPPRKDKENTFRKTILATVYDPKNKKYLCLKWKKQPWTTFITGGIDGDEDPIEAAKREIAEETGYSDLKLDRVLGGPTESLFFAAHKGVNRRACNQNILFKLVSDKRGKVDPAELEKHEAVWLSSGEVVNAKLQHAEFDIIWNRIINGTDVYADEGVLINSTKFDGLTTQQARKDITKFIRGKTKITYKLRDWVFSRQRYWGEPIPVIHCANCGVVAVPEKDLPVELPVVEKYEPGPDGESPLANITEWVNVKCPACGASAKRETDVMPNWAGSSWYFLRYCDHKNDDKFASKKNLKYWLGDDPAQGGVNWYNGGMEHTVLHLLYSRFWNKFLFDLRLVPTNEPYQKRTSHGLILAEGGEKMSKSKGNVVNPDTVVKRFGADTLRLYEMFMGPFEQAIAWSEEALVGPRRFLERVWRIGMKVAAESLRSRALPASAVRDDSNLKDSTLTHQTIKKVSEDIENIKFNTAISALMIYTKTLEKKRKVHLKEFETLLILLAPFAPHMTEELWITLGHKDSIHTQNWPTYESRKLLKDEINLAVQINGKVRTSLTILRGQSEEEIKTATLALPEVKKWLKDSVPQKVIIVPDRIISIVT